MVGIKKGDRLACIPCGRELVVDCCGVSQKTIWCCEQPMKKKSKNKTAKKKAKK